MSINEELGQVEYILTDKTGTLTCNKMEFKNVIVGQNIYGEDIKLANISESFDYSNFSLLGSMDLVNRRARFE